MKKLSDFKLLDHIITFATVPHKNGYSLKKKTNCFPAASYNTHLF